MIVPVQVTGEASYTGDIKVAGDAACDPMCRQHAMATDVAPSIITRAGPAIAVCVYICSCWMQSGLCMRSASDARQASGFGQMHEA